VPYWFTVGVLVVLAVVVMAVVLYGPVGRNL